MQAFFMLVFKILRYIVPPCGTVMEPQHSRYVLNSGKDNIPFLFIVMFNNIDNHHQTNNSSLMATLIHETDRMSSLEIAELTGKRHDNIVRDIRSLLKQGVSHLNFEESSYKQPQPRGGYKELPCFELTKKGCLILAFQILLKTFAVLKSIRIFAMRHFYIHIWFGDFLCPIVSNCIKYKQRFLRTYSPQSQYGSVATWRDSLLSLFINF
nr:MAG TPA: regulatory protein [Caudoviricetes sp.]